MASSNHGWTGRVLRIRLDTAETEVLEPDARVYSSRVGGRGLGGLFLEEAGPRDWDDPESPVSVLAGPLAGTVAPSSGRASVVLRSPLTGTFCDSSVGGGLGVQLKRAGWDGIVLLGRADRPVGVVVKDREVRLEDASGLTGLAVSRRFQALPKAGSRLVVGPAAESGVLFASAMVDGHHAAGRGGAGLALAARNCLFLCITGTGRVSVADKKGLMAAREEVLRLTAASPVLLGEHGFSCYGTGALYDLMAARRMMPTRNFRDTYFAEAPHLNASAFKKRYSPESAGCKSCHVKCKKVAADGTPLPEFESMSHFTALVNNADMETATAANLACNEMGMDTISAAATLACRAEILGRDPEPGEILELLEAMGRGRGEGREMGLGSRRYAEARGVPGTSMSVKSLELPAYDPRGAYGMALAYAVSTRGGCHLRAYPVSHEILRKPVATDRFTFSGKARMVKIAEDANAAVDSMGACKFLFFAASLEEYSKALSAATGQSFGAQDLLRLGEGMVLAERSMNRKYGFTARDDDLPGRFFEEGGSEGPGLTVPPLDRDRFLKARSDYYAVRGLDSRGLPRDLPREGEGGEAR